MKKRVVRKKIITKKIKRKSAKRGKKEFSISQWYKESWEYIKDSKRFIYVIAGIFFLFFLIGFFIPAPESIYNGIMDFIKNLLQTTQDMSQIDMIGFIIYNNIQSTFLAIVFGVVFGIFPLMDAVANGYMLGFVSSLSVTNSGWVSLLKILPHGIFELPAVFIALGLGLRTGMFIFRKKKLEAFKEYAINSLKVFFLIVVPLLIIAGIIEGTLILLLQ